MSKIVLLKLLFSCTTVKMQNMYKYHYRLGGRFEDFKPANQQNSNTVETSNFTVATFLI